ncbi:unnamed protein product, partial [marine sediment metagenome]
NPQSFGAHLEGEDMSTPVASDWSEVAVPKKYVDARISITDQAMQASKGNEAAWVASRLKEEQGLMQEFMQKFSEVWYGTGSGALARVNGAPGAVTFVVDDDQTVGANNTFGLRYIRQNMLLSASANLNNFVMERNFHGTVEGTTAATFTVTVDDPNDLEFIIPMLLRNPQSFGAHLEGEDMSTPVASDWSEVAVPKKYVDARISITDQAMQASKGNEAAWVASRLKEEQGLMQEFMQKFSEVWYGTGSGALARVNGAPGAVTFVVDDDQTVGANNTFGLRYIRQNMLLSASANLNNFVMERNFHGTVEGTTAATFTVTVDDPNDLEFIIPMLLRNPQSFGAHLEGEDMSTPVASDWSEVAVPK